MTAIQGKNAVIEFLTAVDEDGEGVYKTFACASTLNYRMATDLVETTTETSGIWKDYEGQANGYEIDLGGLIPYGDPDAFTVWDLLEVQKQMVGIEYAITFTDNNGGVLKQIFGLAMVRDSNLTSEATGFVNSSFTMVGKGEPQIGIVPTCDKEITSYEVTRDALGFGYHVKIFTLNSGSVPQYQYRLDGGAIQTSFDTGWPINVGMYGDHVLEIWPVCENGARGVKTTENISTTIG